MAASSRLRGTWLRMSWGRMRVWRGGSGTPLLAVHGLGGSGRYWDGLARAVGDRYRVLAPDLAGFGSSDKPAGPYDRDFHLGCLDAVVRELTDDGPVVVVGHSLGAVFAALWAGRHPNRTAGLALAAAAFPTGEGEPEWARRPPPAGMRAVAAVARVAWPVVAVPIGVARGYPAALVMDYGKQRFHSRTRTMVSALYEPDVREDLEAVRALPADVPVLLVNALDDRTVPIDDQERWADLLPHAERRVLEEGGHQFPLRTGFGPLAEWLLTLDPDRTGAP
jgi:pimeloyl-ACP methyl ester carboxylesterase